MGWGLSAAKGHVYAGLFCFCIIVVPGMTTGFSPLPIGVVGILVQDSEEGSLLPAAV